MPRVWFVLLVLLLSACSTTKLAYNNADWLAWRWVDDLFDPSSAQEDQWRADLTQLLEKHREALLPHVLGFLDTSEAVAQQGLTAPAIECLSEQMEALYQQHAQFALPLASRMLHSLEARQIDHLQAELAERNQDFRDDYLDEDLDKRQAERVARYAERIERWTGGLSRQQLALLSDHTSRIPDLAGQWLAYRQAQQQQLLLLLRQRASTQGLRAFLHAWWVDGKHRPTPLRAAQRRWREGMTALGVALYNSLDQTQREHLITRIAETRAELAELARAQVIPTPIACQALAANTP